MNVWTACVRVCADVCICHTKESYITTPNRKARGSLQRAQYKPSTAADGMSLSYLALYSFTSPSPSVSPPLVDAFSQKTLDALQNL